MLRGSREGVNLRVLSAASPLPLIKSGARCTQARRRAACLEPPALAVLLIVPMEELMGDLPVAVAVQQSEDVRGSRVGAGQLA